MKSPTKVYNAQFLTRQELIKLNQLIEICEAGTVKQAKSIIEKEKLNPNFVLKKENCFAPLVQAILAQNWKVAHYLLDLPNIEVNIHGLCPVLLNNPLSTPLLVAAAEHAPIMVFKKLLNKGAEVNYINKKGVYDHLPDCQTPLITCCAEADKFTHQKIKLLIKHKANVNLANTKGYSPLMYAVENNLIYTAETLLISGANPNHRAHDNMTALLLAGLNRNQKIANLLQQYGAKLI